MNQITLRGFEPELERKLRDLARREGISLNRAALKLMRRGAGIVEGGQDPATIGNALDDHFATWTAEEEREFGEAIASTEIIDDEMWK
jgi:hypothetical protein